MDVPIIISQLHKRNNFSVDAFHIAPQSLTLVMVARMEEEQFELDAVLKRIKINNISKKVR